MDGEPYTLRQALDDWAGAHHDCHAAGRAAPFGQSWNHHSREGVRLDHVSVSEFVATAVPGGTRTRLGRLLMENAISEYGADPSAQSSLNLIALIEGDPRSDFRPLAGTDQRYHIRGGNDQLVTGLVAVAARSTSPAPACPPSSTGRFATSSWARTPSWCWSSTTAPGARVPPALPRGRAQCSARSRMAPRPPRTWIVSCAGSSRSIPRRKWHGRVVPGTTPGRGIPGTTAYSYWGVGQTTRFGGYEGVQEGRIHFAGEHTSPNWQGYLEGSATSGGRAADEILAQV